MSTTLGVYPGSTLCLFPWGLSAVTLCGHFGFWWVAKFSETKLWVKVTQSSTSRAMGWGGGSKEGSP